MRRWNMAAALLMVGASGLAGAQQTPPAFVGSIPTRADYAVGVEYGGPIVPAAPVVIAAMGVPAPTLTETGTLPTGISFSIVPSPMANETVAVLSGTPGAGSEGTYNLILTASNGVGADAVSPLTLNIVDGTVPISGGFTANWYDASQSGHGFSIEVLPDSMMLAEWFVFAPDGGQAWVVALGPIGGNVAVLQGVQPVGAGGRFPPNFNPAELQGQPWGTITFTFSDCNNGTANWQPTATGYTSGSIPIMRLTTPLGLDCPSPIFFATRPN